jgi:transcriptional regulator with XRE-family HTH domain
MWENGLREPTMSSLILLADYFGVSIDYLVGRDI